MAKQGILKEALNEAKSLKKAALRNAENSLSGHFRESLEQIVSAQLNESADSDGCEEEDLEEALGAEDEETVMEMFEEEGEEELLGDEGLEEDEELELEGSMPWDDDEDEDEDEDADSLDEGVFSESDLQEVVRQILDEVDHGDLGEPEDVDEDTHSAGLSGQDMGSQAGWEEKDAPAKKDWTVKEGRKMRRRLARALTENKSLKKANKALREAVQETNLFNRKMFYAHKLLGRSELNEGLKMKIVKKLDSAKTGREAKGIYESIEMALGLVTETARKRKSSATPLTEALGRQTRTDRGITKVDNSHILNEGAKFSTRRMQQLAGIIDHNDA